MNKKPLLALLMLGSLPAAGGGNLELARSTLDGGGGFTAGGQFELNASIAQPDAALMTGGGFTLTGGFWARGGSDLLFKDGYE